MTELSTYPAPLERLTTLDVDEDQRPADVDYHALGLEQRDVPALIRIATDRRYDTASLPAAWAPLHAWRALGALRAAEAAEPLTTLFDRAHDDDWILDDLPRALGKIGQPAIPAITQYLAHPTRPVWGRIGAATALAAIGARYPEVREDCVVALTNQLRLFAEQDADLNAFLICSLLDLHAVESAREMEQAFVADRVELSVNGDWEDVQVELGLVPARLTPPRRSWARMFDAPRSEAPPPRHYPSRSRRATEKRRRKTARQSKRRNRRRK